MKIEYFQYAITIITAISALIVAIKKIIDFFINVNSSNIKLKKYITYKEKYAKYYSSKINECIDSEIKRLSLEKVIKIQDNDKQNIYFDIIYECREKINTPLLRKLIQCSYIYNNSIKIFRSDLDVFYKRTNPNYRAGWFIGILAYFIGTVVTFTSLYYRYTIDDLSLFKMFSFYIPFILLYGIFWMFMLIRYKPIDKEDLTLCLKLIKDYHPTI